MSSWTDRRLAAAVLILLLAGCATVGPDYTPPAPPEITGYAAPGEAAAERAQVGGAIAQRWWTLFGSDELNGLIGQAIQDNPSREAARARLAVTRQVVLAQAPQLQAELRAAVQREHINLAGFGFTGSPGGPAIENPTINLYSVGANVSYDFDLFGGARREREYREANVQAAEAELKAAYLSLTGQVVTQVVAIASLSERIDAAEDLVARDRELVALADRSFEGGKGTQLDISATKSELSADEAALPPLRQQLATANHALALLLGKAPSEFSPPPLRLEAIAMPAAVPVSLPSEVARGRPDIRAAEARLHAATAKIGVAEARLYPNLTLSANLTQSALQPEDIFSSDYSGWNVGPLGLQLPLLGRGALKAQSRAALAQADAAAADYRSTVLAAFGQIADVMQAMAQDEAAYAAQGRALAAADETLRLSRLRWQGGKSGVEPVIQAQRAYLRQRQAVIGLEAQRRIDAVQLLLASGGGWDPSTSR